LRFLAAAGSSSLRNTWAMGETNRPAHREPSQKWGASRNDWMKSKGKNRVTRPSVNRKDRDTIVSQKKGGRHSSGLGQSRGWEVRIAEGGIWGGGSDRLPP